MAKLAVTGFCQGGRIPRLSIARNAALHAAVAWYGPVGGTLSPIQPRAAADRLSYSKNAAEQGRRRMLA